MLLVLPLLLASCGLFPDAPPRRARAAAPAAPQAADFVQHLSQARLALAGDLPDLSPAMPDLAVLQAYTAKPSRHAGKTGRGGSAQVQAVVLECKTAGKDAPRLLLVPWPQGKGLQELLQQMPPRTCMLSNLWPATVAVTRHPPLVFTGMAPPQARQAVQARLDALVKDARRPPPLAEAKAHLGLIRFCVDNRHRDAAYLAVEGAKHALAAAEKDRAARDEVPGLLKELEALEAELRQALPFGL